MDEITAANVLRWYESLEEQVLDFMQVVPPQGDNLHVWSPQLATVVVEAGSLIDSVLRDISPARVTVRGTSKKRSARRVREAGLLPPPALRTGREVG